MHFSHEYVTLTVEVDDIVDRGAVPEKYATCAPDGKGGTKDSDNISPAIRWSKGPAGTKSYALIMVDKDVPADFSAANKPGKTIPADAPRKDFYHWVLIDIPLNITSLAEGNAEGTGIAGQNSFAERSKGANGYDGPCPPWNDERLHHYHFYIYALDRPSLELAGGFDGPRAKEAIKNHILAKGETVGMYTTNAQLPAR